MTQPISPEPEIDALLAQLTSDEKIALLAGVDNWHTAALPHLGIRTLTMSDGPHGVRAGDDGTGRPFGPTTAFPTGVGLSATWNPALLEQVGQALAEETLAMGCDILLGPCVNIVRHPLGGRNFESYGEDPYLTGRLAVGYVRGLQSRGAGASLKHFAANNFEQERLRCNVQVDERTLREIYLPHFEAVVKEARPWTVMCAYNRINGQHASQNKHLLTEILKGEWGFDGLVVSDWGANHTITESLNAGLDLEMPGPGLYFGELLSAALSMWQVEESTLDGAVRRVLRILARAGKIDSIPAAAPAAMAQANTTAHQQLACRAAEESMVLLKNEAGALPLDGEALRSVAVIGPHAAQLVIGGGGSAFVDPPYRIAPLAVLQELLGDKVTAAAGCTLPRPTGLNRRRPQDDALIAEAVELARRCEVAVVFVGAPEKYETEGMDRPHMSLPGRQDELVAAVAQANPRTIVVLTAGAPVAMPWLGQVQAVLLAHYPGLEGGRAVVRLLLGQANPSGKLTVSWPVRLQDSPAAINHTYPGARQVIYGEGIFVGYRYFDQVELAPLFPFGHGLSYTTFAYGPLQAPERFQAGQPLTVSLRVRNSGSRPGAEVVQLYVSDLESSLPRPPRELKGFARVELQPGAEQEVTFTLDERAFAFYDVIRQRWTAEPGRFELLAGSSSRDLRARVLVEME